MTLKKWTYDKKNYEFKLIVVNFSKPNGQNSRKSAKKSCNSLTNN